MKGHLIQELGADGGRRVTRARWAFSAALLTALFAAGCHRDNVKVYRIAKDQDQVSAQPAAPALPTDSPNPGLPPGHPDISSAPEMPAVAPGSAPQLTWRTPAGWTEVPPGEMRVGSFKVTGAGDKQVDISVIPLPGMAGTDLANVNRWRGQVGLPDVTDAELSKSAENVEAGGQPAQLYDLAGTNPGSGNQERIIGVIQHRDSMTWFYKMTGDADLVEQQKPAFVEFLKSLNFGATAQSPMEMPTGHPAIGGDMGGLQSTGTPAQDLNLKSGQLGLSTATVSANTVPSVSRDGQPNWQVPAGWQEIPPAQFLLAEYSITGTSGAKAEVNVAQLSGDGGGLLANVNRWRRQIGLDALDDSGLAKAVTSLDTSSGKADLVDMTGTDLRTSQPTRLVGVIVPQNGQTWFYKLMGDAGVVESQKTAFVKFVQGVKY